MNYARYSQALDDFHTDRTEAITKSLVKLIKTKYATYFLDRFHNGKRGTSLGNGFPGITEYELVRDLIVDVFGFDCKELYCYTVNRISMHKEVITEGDLKYYELKVSGGNIALSVPHNYSFLLINDAFESGENTIANFTEKVLPLMYGLKHTFKSASEDELKALKEKLTELQPFVTDKKLDEIIESL